MFTHLFDSPYPGFCEVLACSYPTLDLTPTVELEKLPYLQDLLKQITGLDARGCDAIRLHHIDVHLLEVWGQVTSDHQEEMREAFGYYNGLDHTQIWGMLS
jgi:hypothetical protein